MKFEERLTNEGLGNDRFDSQFDLVNHAIKVAEDMIYSGRDSYVKTESQSRATQILAEIDSGKDVMDTENGTSEVSEVYFSTSNPGSYQDVRALKREEKVLVD